MAAHDVGAVVPVKRLGYALGRLSGVLDRAGRRVLQSAMLGDVLAALAGSARLGEIVVVTSDPRARAVAESVGARTVPDHDPPQGINAAVAMGIAALDARSALVVVSDLPLITAADVDHLVGAGHFRCWLRDRGTEAVIPSTRSRKKPFPLNRKAYARRNVVERLFCRLKNWRRR